MEMNEIDWRKAPEGATHYCADNRLFYKFDGAGRGMCTDPRGSWFPCGDINDYEDGELIPRPSSPAWSGEGLPPVGTVCEVDYCEQWHQCEIIAHFQQRVGMVAAFTVDMGDGAKALDAFGAEYFRPIRTPEQIAAEERESHVLAMLNYDALGGTRRGLEEALYDAGYRKTEAPK